MAIKHMELAGTTYLFSGDIVFMKKHANVFLKPGVTVVKTDDAEGIREVTIKGPAATARQIGKELEKLDRNVGHYGGYTEE
jgi:hypothetical protein